MAMLSTSGDALRSLQAARNVAYTTGTLEGDGGERVPIWPVGVTKEAGEFLRDRILAESARSVLEVGLGLGLSALWIAEGLLGDGQSPAVHTIVEIYPENYAHAGLRLLEHAGIRDRVDFHQADSSLALPAFVREGRRFDLAYVDGAHTFDAVLPDLLYCLRLVRPGGLVLVDDHWMPSVQTAIAFLHTNRATKLELYDPQGSGKRFVGVRVPTTSDDRPWDHFVPFSDASLPEYPWRR